MTNKEMKSTMLPQAKKHPMFHHQPTSLKSEVHHLFMLYFISFRTAPTGRRC